MNLLKAHDIKVIFRELTKVMDEKKDFLIEIDAKVGDGDLGITMQKGFKAAKDLLENNNETDIGILLSGVGIAIAQSAPSTMGTLVGTGFMKAGIALKNKEEANLSEFASAMEKFAEGISTRGKAKPGDKTILDSILPAVKALEWSSTQGISMKDAFQEAYKASLDGLKATENMIPQHGKQVAHREKSKGLQDPGATVGMLIMKTFADYFR